MIEVEVLGASVVPQGTIQSLCERTAASRGIHAGHVAIEFVDVERIAELNAEHRGRHGPTDVLSFPIDGVEPLAGSSAHSTGERPPTAHPPRELGDIVICPEHTIDLREAIVHGMLHLLGMDHEHDDGEMLALQDELLAGAGG
ncbi:MAG TPA: rRNA maturation RNase YbeY [Solirubrobacteraceae bacterium]|jgi:probable rRNA maturation factor|nr:rRNA maturation RNase YbeY [Solirubrobacteraceae bacterium]